MGRGGPFNERANKSINKIRRAKARVTKKREGVAHKAAIRRVLESGARSGKSRRKAERALNKVVRAKVAKGEIDADMGEAEPVAGAAGGAVAGRGSGGAAADGGSGGAAAEP